MKKLFIPILGLTGLLMMSFTVKQDAYVEATYSELDLLSEIESDILGATNKTEFTDVKKKVSFSTYSSFLDKISHDQLNDSKTFTSVVLNPDPTTVKVNMLIEKYN